MKGKCAPSNSEVIAAYLGEIPSMMVQYSIDCHANFLPGCDNFHDGLVCWPQTPPGHQAKVDCLNNVAFAQALKQSSDEENIGEMKQNIPGIRSSGYHGNYEKSY